MKRKKAIGLYGIFAAMAMMPEGNNTERKITGLKESDQGLKARLAMNEIKKNKAKGLKEFFYGQTSIWAINQKTQIEKLVN